MSENPEGAIKIALIEPDARDSARIKELVKTGSVPADILDAMASANPDLAGAEIILLGLQDLGTTPIPLIGLFPSGLGPLGPRAILPVRLQ